MDALKIGEADFGAVGLPGELEEEAQQDGVRERTQVRDWERNDALWSGLVVVRERG